MKNTLLTAISLTILLGSFILGTLNFETTKANPIVPENTWLEKTSMPTERGYLKAAVVNGKIFAIGGNGP